MMITTQTIDTQYYDRLTRRMRLQVATILKKWELLPRFKRWRLTRDPDTAMVVLFGILNNAYIASHTSTHFSEYFDPRVLHDLANELQVQVVSCNCDGLRYAFILERGSLDRLPAHIDYPFVDNDKVFVRVVYNDQQVTLTSTEAVKDPVLVNRGVEALVKIFDDKKLSSRAAAKPSAQGAPTVITIDEAEFNKEVAEHKITWQKSHPG
jgi:hypothetical protein